MTETIFARVQKHPGRPYVHFVLNHDSFAQTVENMFSIAMLVGNAKVALRSDDDWGMTVQPIKGATVPLPPGEPAQMVLNMNYTVWGQMKRAVRPSLCLTPTRDAIQHLATQPATQMRRARAVAPDDDDAPGPSKRSRA